MRPLPPLSDAAQAAVTDELRRLCLPHHDTTDRPELVRPLEDEALTDHRRRSRKPTRRTR